MSPQTLKSSLLDHTTVHPGWGGGERLLAAKLKSMVMRDHTSQETTPGKGNSEPHKGVSLQPQSLHGAAAVPTLQMPRL